MKKITVMGCVALLSFPALADVEPIKIFVGGNLAINGVAWDKEVENSFDYIGDLAESHFGVGAELGIKYARNGIYNPGLSITYDYMLDSKADINGAAADYISKISSGFSAISAIFDNYIRISNTENKRGDIVLGIGFSRITERFEFEPTYLGTLNGLPSVSADDWGGGAVVLKVGYNGQINGHWDWFINGRWFIAIASESDIDALFNLSIGAKYTF